MKWIEMFILKICSFEIISYLFFRLWNLSRKFLLLNKENEEV